MSTAVPPSCQALLDAQALPELPQRNWALSQACAPYQRLSALGKPDEGERAVPIRRILPHPKFNPKTFHADLALLELAVPLAPSPTVSPVCLPSGLTEPNPGTACYIVGWGSLYEEGPAADVVMEAQVPLLSQETCRGALGRDLLTSTMTMFCAGYLSGGIDSCQGDSGGPLACQDRVAAFADWLSLQMDSAPGSREPSCFELLALAQLPSEQQPHERARLCAFYAASCRAPKGRAACAHLAEETCHARMRRCELHSYAQTLVDLLRRAGDFIRNQFDFSFFTRTLPQLLDKIYGHLFPPRVRRDAPGPAVARTQPSSTAEGSRRPPTRKGAGWPPPFAGLFRAVGPRLQDWVEALRAMVGGSPPAPTPDEGQLPGEMWLFLQVLGEGRAGGDPSPCIWPCPWVPPGYPIAHPVLPSPQQGEEMVEELVRQGRAFLTQLRAELALNTLPEATEPQRAPGELAGTPTPNRPVLREKRELVPTELLGVEEEEEEEAGIGRACPGLNESTARVGAVRDLYTWVLQVPETELAMTFQEILVDLGSKNAKGLYRAQVRAMVGGRSTVFTGLVGLESDSLARSMPGLVALALEALKT
ncbi:PREDICTED: LOW QUALITY PROTEIN: serine protease 56 [Mesitornis unicolor]|uniref:LOW QUALITY PROTEIN: serine protease 56 n=1 Tax=Mesitornis unicolor TaxID=54374 RepID=UPI0005281A95|nr:PREDICTED: LOW QUALITY PROTEIN: serine protease 56 [Mesitornis unicolor]